MDCDDYHFIPAYDGAIRRYCEHLLRGMPRDIHDPVDIYQSAVVDLLMDPPSRGGGADCSAWWHGVLRQRIRVVASQIRKQQRSRMRAIRKAVAGGLLKPGRLRAGNSEDLVIDNEIGEERVTAVELIDDFRHGKVISETACGLLRREGIQSIRATGLDRKAFERMRVAIYRQTPDPQKSLQIVLVRAGFGSNDEAMLCRMVLGESA